MKLQTLASKSSMCNRILLRIIVLLPNNKKLKLNVEIDSAILRTRNFIRCVVHIDKWRSDCELFETIQQDLLLLYSKRHRQDG